MKTIVDVFRPVVGQPVWGVRYDGSCLFLQFGEPYLVIRQPIIAGPDASSRVRKHLAQRRIFVYGTWSLMLIECAWRVSTLSVSTDRNDAESNLKTGLDELDGQIVKSVDFGQPPHSCLIKFDLGGQLDIGPLEGSTDTQWILTIKDEPTVACEADGMLVDGNSRPGERIPIT